LILFLKKTGGNVDADFIKKIKQLIKVAIPTLHGKEVRYLLVLTFLLVLRT
jgi:hypothetical protein